jgi:hypothetical protein
MRKIFLFISVLSLGSACLAATITVDDDGPADFNNIQAAINDANDGDTIIIQPGIYSGAGNFNIDFFGKAITVRSIDPNDPNVVADTAVDCGNIARGFQFISGEGQSSILDGLTIRNGKAKYGAGIYCIGSSPTIRKCIIKDCVATLYGAGLYLKNSEGEVSSNVITGNEALGNDPTDGILGGKGGGIYCENCIGVLISENNIYNNTSEGYVDFSNCPPPPEPCIGDDIPSFGAGIYLLGGTVFIIDNQISSNMTLGPSINSGGGIYLENCLEDTLIESNVFSSNKSGTGGAICCKSSNGLIINSNIFSGNESSPGSGSSIYCRDCYPITISGNDIRSGNTSLGAMYCTNSSSYILDNIIVDNGKGGIYVDGSVVTEIRNNIICGNHNNGITCTGQQVIISGNIIKDNHNATSGNKDGGGGIRIAVCNTAEVFNNVIAFNTAKKKGGGVCIYSSTNVHLFNNTIADNYAQEFGGGVYVYDTGALLTSNILWNNSDSGGVNETAQVGGVNLSLNYNCIQGWSGMYGGIGNFGQVPLFADANNGDYHLKSEAGRWDANSQSWVIDANTSPCIDAGDPNSDWKAELWPHGQRINMGAYGGTPQASMSLSTVGNIADLDNDGDLDFNDLKSFTEKWLKQEVLLAADLDRNGEVDFKDYAIFANEWFSENTGD